MDGESPRNEKEAPVRLSYDILSAPVATDEYISNVVGDIIYDYSKRG